MPQFEKHQSAFLDYHVNWCGVICAADGIASARWGVQGNAALPALSATSTGISGTTAYAFLTGGVPGITYLVEHTIWSNSGRAALTGFEVGVK